MKRQQTTDMTHGPVFRQMAVFALPVLLGMLCQRIYNFADVYIVGKFLGDQALAAVSISGSAMYMMTSVMMGVTTGVSVVVSQFYGAGQNEKIKETFAAGVHVSVWVTVIITVVGAATARPLLELLQTGEDLMPQALEYLLIIYLGSGATMLYNFASAVMRALGNSVCSPDFPDHIQCAECSAGRLHLCHGSRWEWEAPLLQRFFPSLYQVCSVFCMP